jgi:hypothetical protein
MYNPKQLEKLIEVFSDYPFQKKKSELLFILRELYWVSDEINQLWELVYSVNDERNWYVLIKVYSLLLESISYAKDKKNNKSIENLDIIKNVLINMRDEENHEKILEKDALDDLLKSLND